MNTTTKELIQRLDEGNLRYCNGQLQSFQTMTSARLKSNAGERKSWALIVSCVDSRVPVEAVFDLELGEAMVVRSPGCLLDVGAVATIELAAMTAKPALVVVLGHGQCLAVTGALTTARPDSAPLGAALDQLAQSVLPMRPEAEPHADKVREGVHLATASAVAQVLERSPAMAELVMNGKTAVIGGYYDLESGRVDWLPNVPSKA